MAQETLLFHSPLFEAQIKMIAGEEICLKSLERLSNTRKFNSILDAFASHQQYLERSLTTLEICQRESNWTSRVKLAGEEIVVKMWQHGFLNLWNHFKRESRLQSWIIALLDVAHKYLTKSYMQCLASEATLVQYLGKITLLQKKANEERGLTIALKRNRRVARRCPYSGDSLIRLSQLVPSNLERLSLLTRATLCRERSDEAGDQIRDFFANFSNARSSFEDQFIYSQSAIFRSASFNAPRIQCVPDTFTEWQISKAQGIQIAFISIGSIFGYGSPNSYFSQCLENKVQSTSPSFFGAAASIAFSIMTTALQHPQKPDVYPYIYVMLTFVLHMTRMERAMTELGRFIPWDGICTFLNKISRSSDMNSCGRPWLRRVTTGRLLAEEAAMAGQRWYERSREDSRNFEAQEDKETVNTFANRTAAIFWAGSRIADGGPGDASHPPSRAEFVIESSQVSLL